MKYFQLEGIINEELLTRFLDCCNNNPDEEITVYINSNGGKTLLCTIITDIINHNSDRFTLVSCGSYSAAFDLFYHAKCKKKIVNQSMGMQHKEFLRDISINSDGKYVYTSDKYENKNNKTLDDSYIKEFMTKKEQKKYKKGDDIYFTFKRMKEIFPEAEIIK